jgi:uncharacterized RDD family membrane protein YckC
MKTPAITLQPRGINTMSGCADCVTDVTRSTVRFIPAGNRHGLISARTTHPNSLERHRIRARFPVLQKLRHVAAPDVNIGCARRHSERRNRKMRIAARFCCDPQIVCATNRVPQPLCRLNCSVIKSCVGSHMDEVTGKTPRLAIIASPWRRLFAFCLDGLFLGAFGACIGLVAYDRLVALGGWGRAVGFAIALIYYGAMDSKLSGGQTLGKRILGVKVVTANGASLGVSASTLRAAIFCVPYFLNGVSVDAGAITSWLLVFLVFGVGLSIAYLLLFNRRTRQSLHDLAVGAYVVSSKADSPIRASQQIWPGHAIAVGLILVVALVLPYFAQRLASSVPFAGLVSVQRALQQDPDVRHASAFIGVSKFVGTNRDATTTHLFSSNIVLSRRVTDFDALANRLARIILDHEPSAEKEDKIAISISYGYDIGIASASQNRIFSFSPEQWRKRLSLLPG